MDGHDLTVWFARIGYLLYLIVVQLDFTGRADTRWSTRRTLWIGAYLFHLAHVLAAYQLVHRWDHSAVWEQTAERTERLVGWRVGEGVIVNHLFLLLWTADLGWSLVAPSSYRRARPARFARHAIWLFMYVNGAILFALDGFRWINLAALGILGFALLAERFRAARPASSAGPSHPPGSVAPDR
jgi:hypothetical protein